MAAGPFRLQILHGSDFEAGLSAIDDAPRFAAVVDRLEDQEANSITLASGDNYIPSPFFNAGGDPALDPFFEESIGRADIRILNTIGIEASVIGNHEFDAGPREVQNLIRPATSRDGGPNYEGTQFPYLAANLDSSGEPDLRSNAVTTPITEASFGTGSSGGQRLAPSAILEENGERIGVVGVTTPDFEDITTAGGVRVIGPRDLQTDADFQALAAVVQPRIDELLAQGVDRIVLVTQLQQLQNEQRLIPYLRGVDIVVGGGSNALLTDAGDVLRPGDTSDGQYAQIIANADGQPTVLVNTDGNYRYVGRLVVEFDANGVIVPGSIDPSVSGAYAADDAGVARVYPAGHAELPDRLAALGRHLQPAGRVPVRGVCGGQPGLCEPRRPGHRLGDRRPPHGGRPLHRRRARAGCAGRISGGQVLGDPVPARRRRR